MKDLILITGASSGIGYHMAIQLAQQNFDLVITARNEESLLKLKQTLTQKYNVSVHVFASDLSKPGNAQALFNDMNAQGLIITKVVNNAGFGLYGKFVELPLDEQLKMIELNVSSVVILTKLFSEQMVKRGSGTILNVASLLSFLPFPYYQCIQLQRPLFLPFQRLLLPSLKEQV